MGLVKQHFGQLQHVVRVATFRTVKVCHILRTPLMSQEVLAHTVSSDAHRAVGGHIVPEVMCRRAVSRSRVVLLPDALKTNELGHLRVGVLAVEECGRVGTLVSLHTVDFVSMAVSFGCFQVFLVAQQAVGIDQGFVHAAMLPSEHLLHLTFCQVTDEIHTPIAEATEELFGHFAIGVYPSIAQSGQNLVAAIEWHPSAVLLEGGEVSAIQACPYLVDRLSADKSFHALCVAFVSLLAILQYLQHVIKTVFHLSPYRLVSGSCISQ